MDQHVKSFKLLFLTDVHESIEPTLLCSLIEEEIQRSPCDALFLGGDLSSIKHSQDEEQRGEEGKMELESTDDYEDKLLRELSTIGLPIYWVPGNHDSTKAFHENMEVDVRKGDLSSSSVVVNCHNRLVQLQEDLFVLGIGGSCIAYEGEEEMWAAYPYSSDIDTKRLESLSKSLTNGQSVIMFTHCPPSSFTSSLYRKPELSRLIQTGSRSLTSFLTGLIKETQIPLYLHGHNHSSIYSSYEFLSTSKPGTYIVTPGTFKKRAISRVNLAKIEEKGWIVNAVETRFL